MTEWWNDEDIIIADIIAGHDSIPAILDKHVPEISRMDRERYWRRVWMTIQASPRIRENGKRRYKHMASTGYIYSKRAVKTYAVREAEV